MICLYGDFYSIELELENQQHLAMRKQAKRYHTIDGKWKVN